MIVAGSKKRPTEPARAEYSGRTRSIRRSLRSGAQDTGTHDRVSTWEEALFREFTKSAACAALLVVGAYTNALAQKQGGTLRMYLTTNPPSTSLHEETTIEVVQPFSAIYSNLVRFDPTKVSNELSTVIPELATSWQMDSSGTKVTFKLREGVKWHDGQPFTAKDVQCTFDRLRGKIDKFYRRNPREAWFENVAEITTNGDHEATFVLKAPQASLLPMLAAGYTAIYPCHVEAKDMRTNPIGTGPFKFVEFKSNQSIKLERNPDYWDKGRPYLDGIEWRIVTNRSTRVLAFTTGEFDMTRTADITVPLLGDIQSKAPNAICELKPTNVTTHMLVNRDLAPFDKPELRRAMMLALDRQAYIDILGQGKAFLAVNMQAPPEGKWGVPAEELKKWFSYGDPAQQRAEAIKIMESLGYGPNNKLKVKVATRDFNNFRDPAVILVDQLNKIHFDATLDVVESSQWYNRLFTKNYSVALNLAGAGIDDPDGVLKMGFKCGSPANFSKYCNPEVDKLLDQQSQEQDPAKRKEIVWQIEKMLVEDVVRPIIFHGNQATCWHPHVKGHVQPENSIYNSWRFDQVWLDK
jgi:peptide/nickel transport system substrate-binding protein